VTRNNTGACVTEGAHLRDTDRTLMALLLKLRARQRGGDAA
jgi:hypothetical protein